MPSYSRRALKDLDNLPASMQARARTIIARLDREPGLGKKLLGPLRGTRSAYLGRSHRILYEVREDGIAHILTIGQRRDVYR